MLKLLSNKTEELEVIQIKKTRLLSYRNMIVKLCLFQFFMGFYLISAVLVPFYLIWAQISLLEISILQSVYMIAIVIFGIPCGAIADKIGRKYCLFFSGLSSAFAALIYSSFPNLLIFFVGELFFAFGTAMMTGSVESYIFDYLKILDKEQHYPKVSSYIESFFLIGLVLSAPLGTIISVIFSLPIVMSFMTIPYLISAIIALTLDKVKGSQKKHEHLLKLFFSGFKKIRTNSTLKIVAIDLIIVESFIMILLFYYPFYLYESLDVPIFFIAIFNSILNISQIVFMNVITNYAMRAQNKKFLYNLSTVIPGVLYILIALILQSPLIITFIIFIIGIGVSRRILSMNAINKQIEKASRTTILSTIEIGVMFVQAFIIPMISVLVIININLVFIVIGFILILLTIKSKIKNGFL